MIPAFNIMFDDETENENKGIIKMTRINVENLIIDRERIVNNIENMLGCRKDVIENEPESFEPITERQETEYETIIIEDGNEL